MSERHPDADLVASLSETANRSLATAVGGARSCALVGHPDYDNVGDSAIWLGTQALLAAQGVAVSYVCDERTYRRDRLAAALRRSPGPILIQGGGNLGDLWPLPERFRQRVIQDFPDAPIVQLPQSIHFRHDDSLAQARRVYDAHPNLTLLLRDEVSLATARGAFEAASHLCPDMAFGLGLLDRPAGEDGTIVWLSRRDPESAHELVEPAGRDIEVVDWETLPPPGRQGPAGTVAERIYAKRARLSRRRRGLAGPFRDVADRTLGWSLDSVARRRVTQGRAMIGSASVVVTDRLHGHILSLLLGIPHVLLDNSYGKVSAFRDLWTREARGCRFAGDPDEAGVRAGEMLTRASAATRDGET